MDVKKIFTNKSFCVLPWTGFELEPNGSVKNCIISTDKIGNIHQESIEKIMLGEKNTELKKSMLSDRKPGNCNGCYLQEQGRNNLMSISSRLYYNKEIAPFTDISLFDEPKNFSLQHVDLRWTNQCNQACVYCGPEYSSKWAKELGRTVKSDLTARQEVKTFVFNNISQLKNVYLAGGEPLLMKENKEFLSLLLDKNPTVNIRVNTNLSATTTGVFELLCKFKNVHWIVSVESMEEEYEYIRYHGDWEEFLKNLIHIKQLNHKISFNMLFFILNYKSIFDTVEFFQSLGFHENSFIIGPLYTPSHLNVLNLPDIVLKNIKDKIEQRIKNSNHYLKNSLENILGYIKNTAWSKDIDSFKKNISLMDQRRASSAEKIFKEVFCEIDNV